ncbi:MAG: histidinol dehydrogenase [Blastocatellia bacterium]|nr:histidinol dehydrogenase [Blastocatellia bacterium]
MKVIKFPNRGELTEALQRPAFDTEGIDTRVRAILSAVRTEGDAALVRFAAEFDGAELDQLTVTEEEFETAEARVPAELKAAINVARTNIERFHAAQLDADHDPIETSPGVECWRRTVAIERVGLYVPGGTAPLFSTVLMLGVPAAIAGCSEVVLCTPAPGGAVADATLYAARLCGITKVFKAGGAQAIAAMAFGTESVPKVDKIFGPGNQWVTRAKQIVSVETAIDMPAGPSEVAVVADETCVPRFVAADLLSQAEHGGDSQVLLISTSESVIAETLAEVEVQLADLPRHAAARAALAASRAIVVRDAAEAMTLINQYAPEHLILALADSDAAASMVVNAGSVFIGNYSCESAGDYASGTNHTLPTGGHARAYSGVSADSFVRKITFQRLSPDGLRSIGPAIEAMAAAEGLEAHRRAVAIRTKEAANELSA